MRNLCNVNHNDEWYTRMYGVCIPSVQINLFLLSSNKLLFLISIYPRQIDISFRVDKCWSRLNP